MVYKVANLAYGRSPYGERGLKSGGGGLHPAAPESLPLRGAWIEINFVGGAMTKLLVAPLTGSVD